MHLCWRWQMQAPHPWRSSLLRRIWFWWTRLWEGVRDRATSIWHVWRIVGMWRWWWLWFLLLRWVVMRVSYWCVNWLYFLLIVGSVSSRVWVWWGGCWVWSRWSCRWWTPWSTQLVVLLWMWFILRNLDIEWCTKLGGEGVCEDSPLQEGLGVVWVEMIWLCELSLHVKDIIYRVWIVIDEILRY